MPNLSGGMIKEMASYMSKDFYSISSSCVFWHSEGFCSKGRTSKWEGKTAIQGIWSMVPEKAQVKPNIRTLYKLGGPFKKEFIRWA